jgi:hypothetical protein
VLLAIYGHEARATSEAGEPLNVQPHVVRDVGLDA